MRGSYERTQQRGMGNEMEEEEQFRNICEVVEMLVQWWYLDRL